MICLFEKMMDSWKLRTDIPNGSRLREFLVRFPASLSVLQMHVMLLLFKMKLVSSPHFILCVLLRDM